MNDVTRSGSPRPDTETDARAAELRFVTRGVTDEETAAVTAVVLAALDEDAGAASVAEPARNPWVQSAHALRAPFPVGPGSWSRSTR
jgi:Acyl-CoA carboxylase epsilon subunit